VPYFQRIIGFSLWRNICVVPVTKHPQAHRPGKLRALRAT
jgi:hypothetical protein